MKAKHRLALRAITKNQLPDLAAIYLDSSRLAVRWACVDIYLVTKQQLDLSVATGTHIPRQQARDDEQTPDDVASYLDIGDLSEY